MSRIGRAGGLLRRAEVRLQAAEVLARLVAQEQVHLLAQLLLAVLELRHLAAEDRDLALALAAPLLQRVHHPLRGVALRHLDLVGRRGPHLALRDLLEPLVDVVHGLAGVVLPHDPAEHVAQLRGEEARRQHPVAQEEPLRHRDVPADPPGDAAGQIPVRGDQPAPVPRLLLGVRGLHELGHQFVDALSRLALAREHRAVVVLVDEERLGRLLELPDGLEFLPRGVDALRRGRGPACSSANRVPKSGSPSPPASSPRDPAGPSG